MLKERIIQNIEYTKKSGNDKEITQRAIIPTFIPKANIKAIDVTNLSDQDRDDMLQLFNEYFEYVTSQATTVFSFEDWVEHSKQIYIEPKWRTFKQQNTKTV